LYTNSALTGYNKYLALTSRTKEESEVQITSSTINTTASKNNRKSMDEESCWKGELH